MTVTEVQYPYEMYSKRFDDRIDMVNKMKEQGNVDFRAKQFTASLKRYKKADELLHDLEHKNAFSWALLDQVKASRALSTQATVLTNMAACKALFLCFLASPASGYLALGPRYSSSALLACDRAMKIDRSSCKCFYRRAKVPRALDA